jgi:outer membrane protein
MKNFLFAIIAIFAFATTQAQEVKNGFSKGDTFVEGTVGFVSSDNVNTFNFNPSVGYFLTNEIAAGLMVNTQSTKTAGVKTADSFGIGAFGRYFFFNIGENFKTYSQLSINSASDKTADTKTLSSNIGFGANYFVSKNLSLTLSLANLISYTSVKTGSSSAVTTTAVGFSGVTNPFTTPTFGLNYRF